MPPKRARNPPAPTRKSKRPRIEKAAEAAKAQKDLDLQKLQGKLSLLPDMPLDILYDIFSFLEPPDIIRLARTSRPLRRLLMRRSSILIWKQAFRNDPDIPPCPDFLSLAKYAALLFSYYCQYCAKPCVHRSIWPYGIRVCRDCSSFVLADLSRVDRDFPGGPLLENTELLFLTAFSKGDQTRHLFLHADGIDLNNRLTLLKNDKEELQVFVAERKQMVKERLKFLDDCNLYMKLLDSRDAEESRKAEEKVQELVIQRLTDMGFHDEIQYLNRHKPKFISEHRGIKGCHELTDTAWAKIKPSLVRLLNKTNKLYCSHFGTVLDPPEVDEF